MKLLKAGVILLSFSAVALASRAVELIPPVFIESPESVTPFYAPTELGYERIIVTQDEEQLFDMINVQRAKEGADPLHWNNQLASAARFHSQEMIDNNYFSHDSKNKNGASYETFGQRILRFNYHYYPIGENIAGCQTVQQAFQGWLDSPGHHENMVRKSFSEAGLGIRVGGPYGKMFTHDFGYRQIEYDLSISSEDISSTQVGSKLLITALVHNPGTTHAYPVMVRFYEGNPEGGGQQLGSDYKVPAIIIGDDYRPDTAKIEWSTSGDSGEIEIYVVVDPENEFEESNESNNIASRTLSYGGVAEEIATRPAAFEFCNCTPNPMTQLAQISYAVPEQMPVRLRVYDPAGRLVANLVDMPHQPGTYQIVWDGRDDSSNPVGAGVYLVCLDNGRQTHTQSLVVVR
ncbi:MAG: CAP domain-containing protein [candidate division WOR-3 bacterium]|nr:CAP domain-containing protein [candidate division WOR-3 bacterium]